MNDLPEPMTPPDCDLRGFPYMPLDVVRLVDSDLFALSTGDEFKAAVSLWCKSWLQIPAGSLPNDERILAHLSGAGGRWPKVQEIALRGWTLCSDGRLYHSVIAEKALTAWKARNEGEEARGKHAEKMRRLRSGKSMKANGACDTSRADHVPGTDAAQCEAHAGHVPSLNREGREKERKPPFGPPLGRGGKKTLITLGEENQEGIKRLEAELAATTH
jgi:hypothetical protein